MPPETDGSPVDQPELGPNTLLARCRRILKDSVRLAIAEIANHLLSENQAEFRMPERPAYIEIIVASTDKKHFYQILYFIQPVKYLEAYTYLIQQPNKIVIREGEFWSSGQTKPSPIVWEDWQVRLPHRKERCVWERIVKTGGGIEAREFAPGKTSVYQGNQLVSGDPSLLPRAAAALDSAFQIVGSRVRSLDGIEKIAWGTEAEPEKLEPPHEGGRRLRQPTATLTPVVETRSKRF